MTAAADQAFPASLPQAYDEYLVPLIFEPYAVELTARVTRSSPRHVLEIAAGTGVVTRTLAAVLPAETSIVATDLNQPMLDQAAARGTARTVTWRRADAMALPFPDGTFDTVVCQFGAMFFPDKARAFAEARRVLRPGGVFVFNVWDRIETNEFAAEVTAALATRFPADPPRFLARTPYGYHDTATVAADLAAAGFTARPAIETLATRSRATSFDQPAIGFCEGTPLRTEIEARQPSGLREATTAAADAIARQFGRGAVDARMQAHVVSVLR